MSHKIAVEVVYALPEKQYLQRVMLDEGATVEAAIRASGILELRRDIDLAKNKVGIYSRPVKLADVVNEGDRVEIYRPLIADPKELRRQRDNHWKQFFETRDQKTVERAAQRTDQQAGPQGKDQRR